MITAAQLVAAGVKFQAAAATAPYLHRAAERFKIDSPIRIAMWLAQLSHESRGFTRLSEDLFYTTPQAVQKAFGRRRIPTLEFASTLLRNPEKLANYVYANMLGNGDESSGDGYKYRGGGWIQLTGQANYMAAGAALGRDYKNLPDLVRQIPDACMTSAWFWAVRGCNKPADAGDHEGVRCLVNGKRMLGLQECKSLFSDFIDVL